MGPGSTQITTPSKVTVLSTTQPGQQSRSVGFGVDAALVREGDKLQLQMTFINASMASLAGFAIQINKNAFGIALAAGMEARDLAPGTRCDVSVLLQAGQATSTTAPPYPPYLQVAIKNSLDIFYFNVPFDMNVAFRDDAALPREEFTQVWQRCGEARQRVVSGTYDSSLNSEAIRSRLRATNVHYVAQRQAENNLYVYASAVTLGGLNVLLEVVVSDTGRSGQIMVRTEHTFLSPLMEAACCKHLGLIQ